MDWEQAPVELTTFEEKSAYSVRFNTSDDALLGPIMVFVDATTKEVLGHALRD